MNVALDSNALVYWLRLAKRSEDDEKVVRARFVVDALSGDHAIIVPGQVFGEAYNVLTKAGRSRDEVVKLVRSSANAFSIATPDTTAYLDALDLAARHKLQFWDALIIRIAVDAGCELLLSEDMQNGFRVADLTLVNPFATTPHPRLAALLSG